MAELQLEQVPIITKILWESGKINGSFNDASDVIKQIGLNDFFKHEKQKLVDMGLASAKDVEQAVLIQAGLTIAAATQDILTILDGELIEKDPISMLESRYGVEGTILLDRGSVSNKTTAEAARSVAEIATRIVILTDANRGKIDETDAQIAINKAGYLVKHYAGEMPMTSATARDLYYDVVHEFAEIARECGVDEAAKTNYITERGYEIRAGIEDIEAQAKGALRDNR